ncbi:MAG: FtsX-like permease family protein [Oscillospiraceae bacterium]
MLSKTQRALLSAGICICLVSVLLFVCSLQQSITEVTLQKKALENTSKSLAFYMSTDEINSESFSYSSFGKERVAQLETELGKEMQLCPVVNAYNSTVLINNETDTLCALQGVAPSYEQIGGMSMDSGSFFTAQQCAEEENVCLVSTSILNLYGVANAEDISIVVNNEKMRVIGTFSYVQHEVSIFDSTDGNENLILIPYTTLARLHMAEHGEAFISYVIGNSTKSMNAKELSAYAKGLTAQLAAKALPETGSLTAVPLYETTFTFRAGTLGMLATALMIATLLMALAGLNMVQIANAAVYNSKSQIALKLAVGATPWRICREILCELSVLCLKAGYFGLAASALCVFVLNKIAGQTMLAFNLQTIILSLFAIFAVVIVSFIIPAHTIFKLSPAKAINGD